jgi:hypothetical protein
MLISNSAIIIAYNTNRTLLTENGNIISKSSNKSVLKYKISYADESSHRKYISFLMWKKI